MRIVLIALGVGLVVFVVAQVHQGLWPVTGLTPWYLLVLLLGLAAGWEAIHGGLLGWTDRWEIEPGRITIKRRNLFWRRTVEIAGSDIARFEVVETKDSDDEIRWTIELTTLGGQRFRTREFVPRANAERFLEKVLSTMAGKAE